MCDLELLRYGLYSDPNLSASVYAFMCQQRNLLLPHSEYEFDTGTPNAHRLASYGGAQSSSQCLCIDPVGPGAVPVFPRLTPLFMFIRQHSILSVH